MSGESHIGTNISCAVIVTNTLIYAGWTYNNWQANNINKGAQFLLNELIGKHSDMNMILWIGLSVLLFILGSLLPDIDSPKSLFCKLSHIYLPIEHRTWTHTIWIIIPMIVGSVFFRPLMYLVFGYTLHMFWDSLSVAGCCWFYPFEKYRYYGKAKVKEKHILKLYYSNESSEYVLLGIIVTLTIIMCVLFATNGFYSNMIKTL